mgnify:CR=1 FL=1
MPYSRAMFLLLDGVLDVEVEKSSGNRNLDRAAVAAARRWRFNAEVRDGKKVASRVRTDA